MRKYKFLLTCLAFLLILSACNVNKSPGKDDVDNLPGGYSYSEGFTNYSFQYQQAAQHLNANDYVQAEEIYRDLIEKEPENFNGYIGLGSSLIFQ